MSGNKQDVEKARLWRAAIREAARGRRGVAVGRRNWTFLGRRERQTPIGPGMPGAYGAG